MSPLPFWDHVEDLRKGLIRSGWAIFLTSLVAFFQHKFILKQLLDPLPIKEYYLLTPLEGFATSAKISLWVGITLSSPFWLYFLLNFLLPGLKKREKKLITPFLALSFIFVILGVLFAYRFTIPTALRFFEKFNEGIGVNLWSLSRTVDLLLGLILAHGVIFELYVFLLFLIQLKALSYAGLKKGRRGVIVAIFIIAAILTPPDVLSQLLLALPMLLLYESALLFARFRLSLNPQKSSESIIY